MKNIDSLITKNVYTDPTLEKPSYRLTNHITTIKILTIFKHYCWNIITDQITNLNEMEYNLKIYEYNKRNNKQ